MSEVICGLLSELEEIGWKIDFSQFAGEVRVMLLPNADVRGKFIFNTDTNHLGVSLKVDTACTSNVHTENFIALLRHRMKASEETVLIIESPGKFEVERSIHRPTLFNSQDESDYATAFWAQFYYCSSFVLSYALILEMLGARPKLKLSEPVSDTPDISQLVMLCLLGHPGEGKWH